MSILYGFPVTEARRRVPLFYKLTEMQEPPAEITRQRRVAGQRKFVETTGNGFKRAKRMQRAMPARRVYPRLMDLGL